MNYVKSWKEIVGILRTKCRKVKNKKRQQMCLVNMLNCQYLKSDLIVNDRSIVERISRRWSSVSTRPIDQQPAIDRLVYRPVTRWLPSITFDSNYRRFNFVLSFGNYVIWTFCNFNFYKMNPFCNKAVSIHLQVRFFIFRYKLRK